MWPFRHAPGNGKNVEEISVAIRVICAIVPFMADLRINDINPVLLANLKSEAALSGRSLRDYVTFILTRRAQIKPERTRKP